MIKEAVLYDSLPGKRAKCTACARYCNIPEGKIGLCGIRRNIDGRLHLLVYGKIISSHVDPIEKKPITHYMPGTKIFSISTTGCCWLCHYCQNYDISQRRRVEGRSVTPEAVVKLAQKYGCQAIAYTYNEPLIFMEFAHDVGVLAREKGLKNAFVSNGYGTPKAVEMMNDFLDCITVDFKGNAETRFLKLYVGVPDAGPIFQTLLALRDKTDVHIEITDLVVPEIGDDLEQARQLCKWLYDNLGPDTPIHFLRFHPDYKLVRLPPTPIETLVRHHSVAKDVGLRYAYVGNVPGHPLENTYCPGCGKIVVERFGFDITAWRLDKDNRCYSCGTPIAIVGTLSKSGKEE